MKTLKKLLATTLKLVVFVGLVGGGYYAYQVYSAEVEEEELGELPTVVAAVRDITVSVSATGVLRPVKIVEIKSKASGEILEMPVETGDYLRAGDLIAQIDTRILDQELKQVEADFESARIRFEIAGRQLGRAEALRDQDLISEDALESSKQNFTNADSQFIRAEASLELARERLADARVTAPISGTVLAKSVEQGQIIASSTNNVSGGTVMLQMADLSELEIRTLVDEIDIGNLGPGLRVESTVEAFAELSFEGEVMKIEPQAEVQQSVTTFPVLSRIDNSEGLLLPGMNADVSIIIHQRSGVLTVSNEAVRSPEDAREVVSLLGLDVLPAELQALPAADASPTQSPAGAQIGSDSIAGNGDAGGADNDHEGNGDAANSSPTTADREAMRDRLRDASPEARERMMAEMGGRRGDRSGRGGRGAPANAPPVDDAPGADSASSEQGVVFVLGVDGQMTPRQIVTGVRDWEMSEVLSGLEAGEQLVLLPSNSLLRSQQSMRERFARRNTVVPGMGR
jgi:HlyD family secretion protein